MDGEKDQRGKGRAQEPPQKGGETKRVKEREKGRQRVGRRGEQTGWRGTKDTRGIEEGRAIFLKNIPQTVAQEGEETRR